MSDSLKISSSMDLGSAASGIINYILPENISCIYSEKNYNKHILSLSVKDKSIKECIAKPLSEWIISNYERQILTDIADEYLSDFVPYDEKDKIINCARKQLRYDINCINKFLIERKLSSYLANESVLQLDGFVKFRLSEYRSMLEWLLYDAAEECAAEREYEEFICMLREYIKLQPPYIELLHIKINRDMSFSFYDFTKRNITISCEYQSGDGDDFICEEDKLIGILMVTVPNRIIWHGSENANKRSKNIIQTISKIFENRFAICKGCELCEK